MNECVQAKQTHVSYSQFDGARFSFTQMVGNATALLSLGVSESSIIFKDSKSHIYESQQLSYCLHLTRYFSISAN